MIDVKPRPFGMFLQAPNNEEENRSFVPVGDWYYTGDKAYKDEDGYLWFIGRDMQVIKASGDRIGLLKVESAPIEHPAVQEQRSLVHRTISGADRQGVHHLETRFQNSGNARARISRLT